MKIAMHPKVFKVKPVGEQYKTIASGWVNHDMDPLEFVESVYYGHPYTVQLKTPFRSEENYLAGQHIALDFDDVGLTPASFEQDPFAKKYALFAYPTLSSTPTAPRSRLVFMLDKPIMQPANMRRAVSAMMHLYGESDKKCKDAARFYFGAGSGDGAYYGQTLPLEKLKDLILKWEEDMAAVEALKPRKVQTVRREGEENDDKGLLIYWERRLAVAREGERNDTLNRAAYSLYQLVELDRLDVSDVEGMLQYQGRAMGLKQEEIQRTIDSAIKGARKAV